MTLVVCCAGRLVQGAQQPGGLRACAWLRAGGCVHPCTHMLQHAVHALGGGRQRGWHLQMTVGGKTTTVPVRWGGAEQIILLACLLTYLPGTFNV